MIEPKCTECGKPIPEYIPEYCCDGVDCCCRGLPIYPPWCDECWNRIMKVKRHRDFRKDDAPAETVETGEPVVDSVEDDSLPF